jgi:hypothetical protein
MLSGIIIIVFMVKSNLHKYERNNCYLTVLLETSLCCRRNRGLSLRVLWSLPDGPYFSSISGVAATAKLVIATTMTRPATKTNHDPNAKAAIAAIIGRTLAMTPINPDQAV